jgi:murein DD-endopeptidase MepM/ murein hydrolase activator NlpD
MRIDRYSIPLLALCVWAHSGNSRAFDLPTANRAIFEPGGEERYFAPTPGKAWTSGTFGCVRSDGQQMHEGLDIRSIVHDRRGEPADPVMASLPGTVVYTNHKPGLSNYGNYIVIKHLVEGMEVFTLYAHLAEIRQGLSAGAQVAAGEQIALMGRTSNTRSRIGKDRAHVHFEINLFVNDRFPQWYQHAEPGQRNDHGMWNGGNLLGLDPRLILLEEHAHGPAFSLVRFIQSRPELCRVIIREKSFPWVRRYPQLVLRNPLTEREGVAGYETSLDLNGVPFRLIPRAASEIHAGPRFQLISVNEQEESKNPCRHLVVRRSLGWQLSEHAIKDLELLVY